MSTEVVIVGAGVAGLAAAAELHAHGVTCTVLEARDRIGGRIFTRHDAAWETPLELGPEFVHGLDPALWQLIREQGLRTMPMRGGPLTVRDGREVEDAAWEDGIGALANAPAVDVSVKASTEPLDEPTRRIARAYVEGFYAARAGEVSAQWIATQERAGDAIQQDHTEHLVAGYDSVPKALAQRLPESTVRLREVVTRVDWKPGEVRVVLASGEVVVGRQAIFTLPPALLARLPVSPALPEPVRAALDGFVMGPVVKIVLRFDEPLWESFPFAEAGTPIGMLHAPDARWPTWWTDPADPLRLTAWAGGTRVDALASANRLQSALSSLADIGRMTLADLERHVMASAYHDWQRDPFAGGAYAYVKVGCANAPTTLTQPVENTLYFAGEATHPEHSGTVHGALESGQRAALAVRRATC